MTGVRWSASRPSPAIRIAIAGHRHLRDAATVRFVAEHSRAVLRGARDRHPRVVALSALAEGADSVFAEAALMLDIPLEVVRPFAAFADDFPPGPARRLYESLRRAARAEEQLGFRRRSEHAYQAAMRWVVDHSDVLVAAWDGGPSAGLGGTGSAVRYAVEQQRPIIHLNVTDLTIAHRPGWARRPGAAS